MASSRGVLLAVGIGAGVAVGLGAILFLNRRRRSQSVRAPDPENFRTPVGKVTKLWVYPVKSCHRIEVDSSECGVRGLRYDRCWVIVTKEGNFVNSRWMPRCLLIHPTLEFPEKTEKKEEEGEEKGEDGGRESVVLHLTAPDMPELVLREPPHDAPTAMVRVWQQYGEGVDVGEEAAQWVSEFLKLEGCRMFYMAPHHKARKLIDDQDFGSVCRPEEESSFSDFSPVLIISEPSLHELNRRLDTPLQMERFRPNIVVAECNPHAEDTWKEVKVGHSTVIRGIKPCTRCKMTKAHPEEGFFTGDEPIATLKSYRKYEDVHGVRDDRFGDEPLFGYNFAVSRPGKVSVGDILYAQ